MDVVQQTIATYDIIAADYCRSTRRIELLECEERFIRTLLSYISAEPALILDVGCADGRHCALIEKNGGKAIGIDLSQNMLKEAAMYYPDGDFRQMDMRSLLFDDNSFDGIWSSGSIYHVTKAEISGVIGEFRRVLKADGAAAVNFKLGDGEGLEDNPRSFGGSPRYFAYYSERDMECLFESFGFTLLEACLFPNKIFGDSIQQLWFRLKDK